MFHEAGRGGKPAIDYALLTYRDGGERLKREKSRAEAKAQAIIEIYKFRAAGGDVAEQTLINLLKMG